MGYEKRDRMDYVIGALWIVRVSEKITEMNTREVRKRERERPW